MIEFLAQYGGDALVASTLVLAVGAIAVVAIRRWDGRQLAAECTVGVALLAGLQAFVPLSVARPVPAHGSTGASPNASKGVLLEGALAPVGSPIEPAPRRALAPAVPSTQAPALNASPRELLPAPRQPAWSRAEQSPRRRGALLPWLLLAGSLAVLAYHGLGCLLIARIHARSVAAPSGISRTVDRLAGARVDSRVARSLRTAFCYGLLRRRLALPPQLVEPEAAATLESVLRHEASHLRRRDALRRTLVSAAAPLLFWNPLFWWLAREASLCAEFIADDAATRSVGKGPYARELVQLATFTTLHPAAPLPWGSHFLRRKGELRRRILMIKNAAPDRSARVSRAWRAGLTSVGTLALAALTLSLGRAPEPTIQDQTPGESPAAEPAPVSYEVELVAPTGESLGAILSSLGEGASASGGWVSVKVDPVQAGTDGHRTVRVRGVALTPRELVAEADRAGVLLISAKAHQVKQASVTEPDPWDVPAQAPEPTGPPFTFEGQDVPITELISSIATASNANFVLAPEVQGHVTVRFHEVPWREALDASVGALGYRVLEEGRSVLRVVPAAAVSSPSPFLSARERSGGGTHYTVRVGDSLARIAHRVYGRAALAKEIARANGLDSPDALRVGQVLVLPRAEDLNRSR